MTIVELKKLVTDLCLAQGRASPKPSKSWKHFDGREWIAETERRDWEADSVRRYCNEKDGRDEE